MSEKPYDKKALIQYRMERAHESLNDARLMLAQKGSNASIVNRAYYAMFYAALALLITIDKGSSKHQGVIAFLSQVEEQDLNEVITRIYEQGGTPLILALDNVTDVRNMGAIARSAECFGAHALLVPKMGTARLGPDAVKSSAGALLRKPVCRVARLTDGLRAARDQGLRIVACTEKGAAPLAGCDLTGPLAIVMGAEDEGISDAVMRLADELVRIPRAGSIGSLNVSVATGIILHAALSQRQG